MVSELADQSGLQSLCFFIQDEDQLAEVLKMSHTTKWTHSSAQHI